MEESFFGKYCEKGSKCWHCAKNVSKPFEAVLPTKLTLCITMETKNSEELPLYSSQEPWKYYLFYAITILIFLVTQQSHVQKAISVFLVRNLRFFKILKAAFPLFTDIPWQ